MGQRLACRLFAFGCAFSALAAPALAQTTALYFDSQPGDFIGDGAQRSYTPADTTFSINRNSQEGVSVSLVKGNYDEWWDLHFASYESTLGTGSYAPATRYPFATFHGLSFSGTGRGCNELVGRFVVLEAEYGPGGEVVRFAADFEQHCDDRPAGLYGAVRYNSTISSLVPFGGAYPSYGFIIVPPQNGNVSGDAIDCGMGNTHCLLTPAGPRTVTLTASPAAGYLFAGWTGGCHGSRTITVNLNMEKICGAQFEPIGDLALNTMLFWTSQRGDYIGHGAREIYAAPDTRWTAATLDGANGVRLTLTSIDSRSEVTYWLEFRAPEGGILAPGTYAGATRAPFRTGTPGIEVSGDGRGCNQISGSFVVHELLVLANGTVAALAVDFEQRCDNSPGRLFGSLRFNSAIDPVPTLLLNVDGTGRIAGLPAGASCVMDCAVQLPLGTRLTLSATPPESWSFDGWSEDADCTDGQIVVTAPAACAATFTAIPHVLRIDLEGEGRVSSTPSGIVCGRGTGGCSWLFQPVSVHLSVAAAPGWRFAGWQGDPGCGADMNMTVERSCRAVFERIVWFGGDFSPDVVLQHEATGCMVVWDLQGDALRTQRWITPNCVADPNWRVSAVADFDRDGHHDLLFQHLQTGGLVVWLMNGVDYRQQVWLVPGFVSDPAWRVSAVGDFDDDGNVDLILQHRGDGRMVAWLLIGTVLKRQEWLTPNFVADPDWHIVGAGDVDADDHPDLFFQNVSSGQMVAWIMNGLSVRRQEWIVPSQVPPSWRVSGVADMNGDGMPDLLLQNVDDGRMVIWPLSGTRLISQLWLGPGEVADPRWRIVGPR